MKIDENYSLETDSNNWILKFKSNEKTHENGKKYYSFDEWYFPSLSDALKKYVDQTSKVAESIDELILLIKKSNKIIESLTP